MTREMLEIIALRDELKALAERVEALEPKKKAKKKEEK